MNSRSDMVSHLVMRIGSLRSGLCEERFDREHVAAPARGLAAGGALAGCGKLVVFRSPSALGHAPFAADPVSALETLERGIERALIHLEGTARELLNPLADSPPVHRREGERLEHQQIDRAAERLGGGLAHAS